MAKNSARANACADAALIAIAEQYVVAEQKWCDLNRRVDDMAELRWDAPVPEVLRWRETDAGLGLPLVEGKGHDLIWDRPSLVEKLRSEKWFSGSKMETEDEMTVTVRTIVPSPAARARAAEIIAAFDNWHAKKDRYPRGYKKAVKERNKAEIL